MKIRYSVVVITALLLLYFAFLGFAPHEWIKLPSFLEGQDKVLHFSVFFITTILLNYIFIFTRTFLYWTGCFIAMLAWSVISEAVQSIFPYRIFDVGDIYANLLGTISSSFLVLTVRFIIYKYKLSKTDVVQEEENIPLV